MSKNLTFPVLTRAKAAVGKIPAASHSSHIDDSDFFVNPPIRSNLTGKTLAAYQKNLPNLPTHFEGLLLPDNLRENFLGVVGAYTRTVSSSSVVSITTQSDLNDCTDEEFGQDDVSRDPIVGLASCNAWLQLTYAHELTELHTLGAYVQAREVFVPHDKPGPNTRVLLTVKDGLIGGKAGLDGDLTFTFWDTTSPKVALGELTMEQFKNMARRLWQEFSIIKDVYQSRADYIASAGASPVESMPEVENDAPVVDYNWFMGDTLPRHSEGWLIYPQARLLALADTYRQWADHGV